MNSFEQFLVLWRVVREKRTIFDREPVSPECQSADLYFFIFGRDRRSTTTSTKHSSEEGVHTARRGGGDFRVRGTSSLGFGLGFILGSKAISRAGKDLGAVLLGGRLRGAVPGISGLEIPTHCLAWLRIRLTISD